MLEYARVYLLDNPYFLDKPFEYYIPPEFRGKVERGDFVTVPFGTSNRRCLGLCAELRETPDDPKVNYKPIVSVCDRSVSLDEEMLGLCFFLKEQTLCTVGDAVRAMIPASAISRLEEVYRYAPDGDAAKKKELDSVMLHICEFIRKKGSVRMSLLKSNFGPAAEPTVKKLLSLGLVEKDFEVRSSQGKSEYFVSLAISFEDADRILKGDGDVKLRSVNHLAIIKYLFDTETSEIRE